MIKYAIFDVGQVCYPYSLNPLNEFCRQKTKDKVLFDAKSGVKSFDYDPFMAGEVNYVGFCMDLCKHCGIEYERGLEIQINRAMHEGVGEFFPETLETMQMLRERGVEVCLLSNALPNLAGTGSGLVEPDKAFVSYELGLLKPDKRIYEAVLKKLVARPEEVIFIDDKSKNVMVAQALGIKSVVYHRETIKRDVMRILTEPPMKQNQKEIRKA